jgi:hypothetical protein
VPRFSTSIPAKKSSTKLFGVIQQIGESTRTYLKRFSEEILKVEELLEPVAFEALIRGVREHALWKNFMLYPTKTCSR